MSSAGSSPAGVGGSPSILARALPSPLSGSYSWPSPTGFSSGDDDPLFRYVANLGPGVGTSTTPPVDNAPPAGTGTPSPARSAGRQSPVRGTAVGVGTTTTTTTGGLSTRNLPGRAATPPGRGYLAGRGSPRAGPSQGSPRPGPSRPTRGGKQPRRGLGGRPSRGGKQPRRGLGRGGGGGGGGGGGTPPSTDEDDDESDVSTPRRRRPRRMNQEGLQRQLEILLNDQRQTADGRRIAGITTTNTITTTYKDGGRPRVTRNSTSVRS